MTDALPKIPHAAWPARIAEHGLEALKPYLLAEVPALPRTSTIDPVFRDGSGQPMPAAVLLPIVARPEPTVLFTRRTPHLARHAGQVSFPGGRAHDDDPSLIRTALRETEEETGITSDFVTVGGFLDPYETGSGFVIVPVVGRLREGFRLVPDPGEVDEVFEVPLSFLLDPANRERKKVEWRGRQVEYYAFTYGRHYIWGATAAILVNFMDRLGI